LPNDLKTGVDSQTGIVEQINVRLRSGQYSRALDLLRVAAAEFPSDPELAELEKRAQDGIDRNTEAQRLITESQELFAQQRSAEAIQLLRKAYELDKKNSLARAILANALVEHAHTFVENDWLEAEKLTNQALAVNPAHPTAKTILNLIVEKKEKSSAEDWVSHASRLQSSGDLFGALAWVAEGLAVHPDEPRLLQIHDGIQRDQGARRRQARRQDLEDLRRMAVEIDGAVDVAVKQALGERIQALAARYWSDGEVLSIANALLLRMGLIPRSLTASPHGTGAPVIFHVPRASAPKPSTAESGKIPPTQISPKQISPTAISQIKVPENKVPVSEVPQGPLPPKDVPPGNIPITIVAPIKVESNEVPSIPVERSVVPTGKIQAISPKHQATLESAAPAVAPSALAANVTARAFEARQARKSSFTTPILISSAAMILIAVTLFFTRKHPTPPAAKTPSAAPIVSTPSASAPAVSEPTASAPAVSPAQTISEPPLPASPISSDTAGKVALDNQPPEAAPTQTFIESAKSRGSLLVIAGQDNARVFLNGKLQGQLTQAGRLRIPNLEAKDYAVQISKSGFQDSSQQEVRIHSGEQARLIFNLQPQPRLASLIIQGGVPGASVFVDQNSVGIIQPDGTLRVSTINPGDRTVELRKERFKPRMFKEHFVVGGTISLAAADAALEAASGELKITFTPADSNVAIAKGELLKMVRSGVPLSLAPGTYTLTARTAEKFTRTSTVEIIGGQSKSLDLSLAPNGMSKWEDPGAWKHEKDSLIRRGGDFALYSVVPASGTFVFSAMPIKGHLLQWVLNYTDPKNYVLFQMDDNNFYRTVIRNGEKKDRIMIPDQGNKKSLRTLQIRVSATELVHQIKHGDSWTVLDRWTQPGTNLSLGKFGFYIPGNDEVALSGFAHYADLNIR
jgi:hypothetical protein